MKNLHWAAESGGAQNPLGRVFRTSVALNAVFGGQQLTTLPDTEVNVRFRIIPIRFEYGPGETAPSKCFERLLAACILAEIDRAAIFLCAGVYLCPTSSSGIPDSGCASPSCIALVRAADSSSFNSNAVSSKALDLRCVRSIPAGQRNTDIG